MKQVIDNYASLTHYTALAPHASLVSKVARSSRQRWLVTPPTNANGPIKGRGVAYVWEIRPPAHPRMATCSPTWNSDRLGGWGGGYHGWGKVFPRLGEGPTVGWRHKPKKSCLKGVLVLNMYCSSCYKIKETYKIKILIIHIKLFKFYLKINNIVSRPT